MALLPQNVNIQKIKAKIKKANLGKQYSQELKPKISKNRLGKGCKQYHLLNPNGDRTTVVNMVEFCKFNNLNYKSITSMLSGRTKQHQKYKLAI